MKRIVVTDVLPILGNVAYIGLPAGRVIGCAVNSGRIASLQVWQEVDMLEEGLTEYVPWMLWVLRAKAPAPVLPLTVEWSWTGLVEVAHQPAAIYLRPQRVGVDA